MPHNYFKCADFRCLKSAELELNPHYNLVYGPNASGQTSLLEAIAYLGRGRSFRGAATEDLTRYGAREFVLFGKLDTGSREATVGVKNGREGLEIHVDGIDKGQKVLVVDDLLATGGTAKATCKLIERLGGQISGVAFVIELAFLNGRDKLKGYDVFSLLVYDE